MLVFAPEEQVAPRSNVASVLRSPLKEMGPAGTEGTSAGARVTIRLPLRKRVVRRRERNRKQQEKKQPGEL